MRPAMRRARTSTSLRSASSVRTSSTTASSRASSPRTEPTSVIQASRLSGSRPRARSTSSALTLPLPSQIELSGDSRNSSGMPDSSTYPLPPRHSSASATMNGVRLQTQNFSSARPMRRRACSCGSSWWSTALASRSATRVAASLSTARSASTLVIAGWSASVAPNAARCEVCQAASARALRMMPADPRMQSIRVAETISMIVRMPRPSSPRRTAWASLNSSSLEALDRLPSLSLSRTIDSALRLPSGRTRGTTKHVMPSGAWARTRKTSFIGADVNHLWPVMRYSPWVSVGAATVVLVRRSEPPCFSVMPMPASRPAFCSGGRSPKSYVRDARPVVHCLARASSARRAGTTAYVMVIGHMWPCSV